MLFRTDTIYCYVNKDYNNLFHVFLSHYKSSLLKLGLGQLVRIPMTSSRRRRKEHVDCMYIDSLPAGSLLSHVRKRRVKRSGERESGEEGTTSPGLVARFARAAMPRVLVLQLKTTTDL